jgi:hypothetical protein
MKRPIHKRAAGTFTRQMARRIARRSLIGAAAVLVASLYAQQRRRKK